MKIVISICSAILLASSAASAATLTLRSVRTSALVAPVSGLIALEIRASFDVPLAALQLKLVATGSGAVSVIARSAQPQQPGGLTFLSRISQVPFQAGLPHNLKTMPLREVFYDAEFGRVPGGPADGLSPGSDLLIETLTLRADQAGEVKLTLTHIDAATTINDPDGALFETAVIDSADTEVTLLLGPVGFGDANADGAVNLADHAQFAACMTEPCPDGGCANPLYSTQNACDIFDADADGDVDLQDAGAFQTAVVP